MLDINLIKDKLFPDYTTSCRDVFGKFYDLKDAEISTENFSFYTSVSSVFSSKIEGESIELDSFIKHKHFGGFQPDYTKKIDDLYEAYIFAQNTPLNGENLMQAHTLLSRNILAKNQQGVYRTSNMFVLTESGNIEYVAANPAMVGTEMQKFFNDLKIWMASELEIKQVFFCASLLHLLFVKIHPMNDGNGRLARLLEKWFMAEKLGEKAWFLQSEKYYYKKHQLYYQNLRKLGLEYEALNWENALDFLKMLPQSLII